MDFRAVVKCHRRILADPGGSFAPIRSPLPTKCEGKDRQRKEVDMEAISCLLDFARREPRTPPSAITTVGSFAASGAASGSPEILVRTFKTSTPKTPATAPRTDCPPRISSRRVLPGNTPRALRRPPSAALGAPPRQEGEESSEMELEIPDIPDTPQSPTMSDITVLRLVLFFYILVIFFMHNIFFSYANFFLFFSTLSSPVRSESPWLYSGGYTSDDLSEYEYGDPYEGEGPHSDTPPPPCEGHSHQLCVPPAWGERIPGSPVTCRCILCHEDNLHHAISCIQCMNAPGRAGVSGATCDPDTTPDVPSAGTGIRAARTP